jgi:hypothetical protein
MQSFSLTLSGVTGVSEFCDLCVHTEDEIAWREGREHYQGGMRDASNPFFLDKYLSLTAMVSCRSLKTHSCLLMIL